MLDTIDQFIDTKDKTAGQAMADTYKALFTKLISFLPGGDMSNNAVSKFMSIIPKPPNLQKESIFERWAKGPDVSPIWKVVKKQFAEDDEPQIYYIQDVNIMSPTFGVLLYYRSNLPNPSAKDLIKPFLNKNILYNYALAGYERKEVNKNDIVNPTINKDWRSKINNMSPKDYMPSIYDSYYNTNILGKGIKKL